MKRLLMNDENPCFCRELARFGYDIIPAKKIESFLKPEQRHADMQLLRVGSRVFTLDGCALPEVCGYPDNVRLNCLFLGGRLYGKLRAADPSVLDFCRSEGIECVNVNQGYTRCSALALNDHAVITSDSSIQKALESGGAEVLRIKEGHIRLDGYDYGFIGGASFADDNTVFFFGNAKKHPDFEKIKAFCDKYHSKIEILCREEPLTDIGGAVIFSCFSD